MVNETLPRASQDWTKQIGSHSSGFDEVRSGDMEISKVMSRIEGMLSKLLAEKHSREIDDFFRKGSSSPPPTPDPPDSFRTRQIIAHNPQPINHEGQIYSGNQATRYEFPKFNGTLIRDWIWRCEQLFFLNRTPPEVMVREASLHFEGKALQWHNDYIRNRYGLYPSWPEYMIAISNQFGREWDVEVIDHNRWVGSNDVTDWKVHGIDGLKEHGLVDIPTVIDDGDQLRQERLPIEFKGDQQIEKNEISNSFETNKFSNPVTHQVLEKLPKSVSDNPISARELASSDAHQVFDKSPESRKCYESKLYNDVVNFGDLNQEDECGEQENLKAFKEENSTIELIVVEESPIVAIESTVPSASAHQVSDKMSAQNESKDIEVSDYLNEPLDLVVSHTRVHEKREVMYEFSRLEAPQMLEEMQEESSGLVICLPFDERSGLMEKGICLLEVYPKEIVSATSAVSPNKGQSALMSFDPGGKWPPISAKCEIKEVASMSDGDPNQIDEGLMLNPSCLSINQPRLRADGLLGISSDIEKCIKLPVSDLDLRRAYHVLTAQGVTALSMTVMNCYVLILEARNCCLRLKMGRLSQRVS